MFERALNGVVPCNAWAKHAHTSTTINTDTTHAVKLPTSTHIPIMAFELCYEIANALLTNRYALFGELALVPSCPNLCHGAFG